jgi:hypothetical protein
MGWFCSILLGIYFIILFSAALAAAKGETQIQRWLYQRHGSGKYHLLWNCSASLARKANMRSSFEFSWIEMRSPLGNSQFDLTSGCLRYHIHIAVKLPDERLCFCSIWYIKITQQTLILSKEFGTWVVPSVSQQEDDLLASLWRINQICINQESLAERGH